MIFGLGTFIINFPGPASPQRHGPSGPADHALTCTPFPEEPEMSDGAVSLVDPVRTKGTAFTADERHELGLLGLLPHAVSSLDEQVKRSWAEVCRSPDAARRTNTLPAGEPAI